MACSGACFPFAGCRQTPYSHTLVHKYSLPTSHKPCTDLSLAALSIPQKAKYLFLKKELAMEGGGVGCLQRMRLWSPPWGHPSPVISGHLCPHLPGHTHPLDPTNQQLHSTHWGPALRPGSLISVHCYSGNLDSALEFYWSGL